MQLENFPFFPVLYKVWRLNYKRVYGKFPPDYDWYRHLTSLYRYVAGNPDTMDRALALASQPQSFCGQMDLSDFTALDFISKLDRVESRHMLQGQLTLFIGILHDDLELPTYKENPE